MIKNLIEILRKNIIALLEQFLFQLFINTAISVIYPMAWIWKNETKISSCSIVDEFPFFHGLFPLSKVQIFIKFTKMILDWATHGCTPAFSCLTDCGLAIVSWSVEVVKLIAWVTCVLTLACFWYPLLQSFVDSCGTWQQRGPFVPKLLLMLVEYGLGLAYSCSYCSNVLFFEEI